MKLYFYLYDKYSVAGRELARACNAKTIKLEDTRFRPAPDKLVINWGNSNPAVPVDLNQPRSVGRAIHKLRAFERFQQMGVSCPLFTQSVVIAQEWSDSNYRVVGRDLEGASGGRGITLYDRGAQIGNHRFYTRYVKKQREFRIHVFNGDVIFQQEKLKKNGVEDRDKYIRSHNRGWVFAFRHLEEDPVPESVITTAINAIETLELDFGGVDIGYHELTGATVFEVNTAPGIEETSLDAYRRAINDWKDNHAR